jgi:hypothetical protein
MRVRETAATTSRSTWRRADRRNPNDNAAWHLETAGGTNGQEVDEITSAQTAIPSEPMEVIMNSSLANSSASGWYTSVDSSTPSTLAMQVGDVDLHQLPGRGDTVTGANVTALSGGKAA